MGPAWAARAVRLEGVDHEERLRQANRRCEIVLSSTLAQSQDVLEAGSKIVVWVDVNTREPGRIDFRPASVGIDAVAVAAAKARVFTLKSEDIHFSKIIAALRALSPDPRYGDILDGLQDRWERAPVDRSTTFVRNIDGTGLPASGVTDGRIANRVLYSEIVHADDAAAILDHISDEQKQWALTGMVVDWVCLVAQTQHLMHLIRPDVVPSLTSWTGTPTSLFERWGATWVVAGGEA